ncbi:unnamed protein product [Prorocentrum cordatum]|uniref:Uncharacterized protein n=1 Tax=Prorocentrum cordatum TaxID=2364126 RepID=A0ABN9V6N0_9DINO|nr:unnamed protein product [Polarella glacialis]
MVEKPSADVREFARMWFSGSMLARLLPVCLRSFRHAAVNLPLAVLALSQFHLLCWGRLSTHEPWGRGGRHRAVLRRRSPACHGEDRHEHRVRQALAGPTRGSPGGGGQPARWRIIGRRRDAVRA